MMQRKLLYGLLLVATLCCMAVAQRKSCSSSKTCGSGDRCCPDAILGDVCYDPSTHHCLGFIAPCGQVNTPQPPLIPPPTPQPNVTQSNTTQPNVSETNTTMPQPPPMEPNVTQPQQPGVNSTSLDICGKGSCFDQNTGECFLQKRLCGINDGVCGSVCFDSSMYVCFQDNKLCPKDTLPCGEACYQTDLYICNVNLQLEPMPTTQLSCGGTSCSHGEDCCMGSARSTDLDEAMCFNPSQENCCKILGSESSSTSSSLAPLVASCGVNRGGKAELCCPSADGSSADCYDPDTHFCCHDSSGNIKGPICSLNADARSCCGM